MPALDPKAHLRAVTERNHRLLVNKPPARQ
jgi:hypothetical protein